ncbi:MAG TPA: AAA family ATPase [Pseudonocardiaceae bacterium]
MSNPGWRPPGRPRVRHGYYTGGPLVGDFYGLSHEAAIMESGVRQVFTPHQPVQPGEELAGRKREVRKLVEVLNTPGQHALLYGDRGVGKSSLANVVSHAFRQAAGRDYFVKRCDHTDTFESIFRDPLAAVGVDVLRVEYVTQEITTRKAEVAAFDVLTAGRERQHGQSTTYRPEGTMGASEAARHLAGLSGFMLIDELDGVGDPVARRKVAELIKQLSDLGSAFKLLLVGIAETATDLTGAHPSVQRSLRETKLHLMAEETLRNIIARGAHRLGLSFDDDVMTAIARLSAGYPHFTHLLALKCAENAIRNGQRRVEPSDLPLAMTIAVEDAEGTLRQAYHSGVRASAEGHRAVLTAAASLDGIEFTTAQLRDALPPALNPAGPLRRLVSDDGATILRRTTKGVYRFSDPRMRSYIRIIHLMIDPIG